MEVWAVSKRAFGKNYPVQKQMQNDLTSEAFLWTMQRPLHITPGHPTPMPREPLLASIVLC